MILGRVMGSSLFGLGGDEVGKPGGEVLGGGDGDGPVGVFSHVGRLVRKRAARRWNQPGDDILRGRHDE